jgi:arginyl-tRNA synthetase
MRPISRQLADSIAGTIADAFDVAGPIDVPVEVSGRPDLGDYASPVAFALARVLRRSPAAIASRIADGLAQSAGRLVSDASATSSGYINVRLAPELLEAVIAEAYRARGHLGEADTGAGTKIVIEHTNINPNKAAHVGHFRNACLGDSLARILRRVGYEVEVQNYIDDTGVQVADIVVGLELLGLGDDGSVPFDRHCSAVYAAVQQAYAQRPELMEQRAAVQSAVESGQGELAVAARRITRRIAEANLATMARAGVGYDLLTWESHILGRGFWQHAFSTLRERGAIRYEDSGPNAGCWVLPYGAGTLEAGDRTVSEDKVLVTGRGIATYTAKDIAYQLWKFGLLGLDFAYERWPDQPDGRPLWSSTNGPPDPAAPRFAHGQVVINVIDATQSYLQQIVYDALRRLGYATAADRSEHLAYERVVLSPATARELAIEVPEGASAVAMTGRGGMQVFADDLLDWLAARAAERGAPADVAGAVAAGAARYYMLKYSNNQQIVFDVEESLRTTGETGVYLQYALVRARGIARKLGTEPAPAPMPEKPGPLDRALALALAAYPAALERAASQRSPQVLAKYAFDLASAFSAFYDNTTPVVQEGEASVRSWRAGLVGAFAHVLTDVLDALGIPAIDRM